MPEPATQVRADDEPVSLHFTQLLREHFLGRQGEHPAQLTQSRGSPLEAGEDSDFPLPSNERNCESNRLVFLRWGLVTKSRSSFLSLSLCISTPNGYGFAYSARHDFVALLA